MTAKTKNRATMKARAWNHHDVKKPKPVAATGLAWWIPGAQPDGRAAFMVLARQRDAEARWSNIVPHAASPRWEFS